MAIHWGHSAQYKQFINTSKFRPRLTLENLIIHQMNTDIHKREAAHKAVILQGREEAVWKRAYQQRSTFLQEIIFRQSQREHEVNASGDNGCLFHPRHFPMPRITWGQHWPSMNESRIRACPQTCPLSQQANSSMNVPSFKVSHLLFFFFICWLKTSPTPFFSDFFFV